MPEISTVPEDVTALPLHGRRVRFDGTNADALQSLAGDRWRGTAGEDAFVLGESGRLTRIHPGWVLLALEGEGGPFLVVATPDVAVRQWPAA